MINTLVTLGVLVIILIVILIFTIMITRRLNKIDENIRRSDSKLNDLNCVIKRPLYRIEQRCDAIDQRTKAHLVSKKKSQNKNTKTSCRDKGKHNEII